MVGQGEGGIGGRALDVASAGEGMQVRQVGGTSRGDPLIESVGVAVGGGGGGRRSRGRIQRQTAITPEPWPSVPTGPHRRNLGHRVQVHSGKEPTGSRSVDAPSACLIT
ncbi:hypothetical protein CcI49_29140 [Frankia sp. CcI49]|nr:hypothetical protein CcI49_38585 [Frankia sp. CcI49]ONH55569.1 hypothetical protein CcI49_29140 [Frankia sp. CcI49]